MLVESYWISTYLLNWTCSYAGTAAPPNTTAPAILAASNPLSNPTISAVDSGSANAFDEVLKATPPALVAFLTNLPALEGNFSNFYCSSASCNTNCLSYKVIIWMQHIEDEIGAMRLLEFVRLIWCFSLSLQIEWYLWKVVCVWLIFSFSCLVKWDIRLSRKQQKLYFTTQIEITTRKTRV